MIPGKAREEMASQSFLDLPLTVFGGLAVLWFLLKAVWDLGYKLRVHLLSEVWKGVNLASYGPWAVVTGATNGIGKAYAHELARRGLNVVLISRSLEKLKHVAREIEEQHGRSTKVIQMDFTQGSESYKPVQAALQDLEVGILVNNVGKSYVYQVPFLNAANIDKFIHDILNCNILSTMKMTRIILPQMVARKKGIIINISSLSAVRPFPLAALYSSTKAFVDFFSQALDVEYSSQGIIVQSILPSFVQSGLTTIYYDSVLTRAEAYARRALNTVGLTRRTTGCLSHSIQGCTLKWFFPEWLHFSPAGMALQLFLTRIFMKKQN